jgi:predicted dehydrogenase
MKIKIKSNSRRDFIKRSVGASVAVAAGGILPGYSALGYSRIMGSNDRVKVSVMGVNSRGYALARNFARQDNCDVIHICDVDSRAIQKCIEGLVEYQEFKAEGYRDFRKSLESKDIDALVIAAPDHWHAPAALLAVKAGKHVYVEKPCSHNPAEGEILVNAAKKYGRHIQMGNQRRSYPNMITAMQELKDGIIGRAYFGKGWYCNNRGPIGVGKDAEVPEWLDWDLWQGPAPRKGFKDNVVHYNWHWFWHWGTGEALNNGTHMIDMLRWGLDVNYPVKVSSNGGRYRYEDDWETPDTQVISIDFKEGVTMSWEGRSCNGKRIEGSSAGAMFYGEEGSMLADGNSYTIFDLNNNIVKDVKNEIKVDPLNVADPGADLDSLHIRNFLGAILKGDRLNAEIESGHKSTLLVQLGNIAQRVGRSINIDHETGHIIGDEEAKKYWARTYEKGWEMKI